MADREATDRSSSDLRAQADALERMLRAQHDGHTKLLACIERKRRAIAAADMHAIESICGEENAISRKLCEIEKHRLELIGKLTQQVDPTAQQPLTVSEIAAALDEPQQTLLTALASQLRDAIGQVKHQSSIVRVAAETLSRHMTGIAQTVQSALSRAGVYGNSGRVLLGAQVHSAVDVKS